MELESHTILVVCPCEACGFSGEAQRTCFVFTRFLWSILKWGTPCFKLLSQQWKRSSAHHLAFVMDHRRWHQQPKTDRLFRPLIISDVCIILFERKWSGCWLPSPSLFSPLSVLPSYATCLSNVCSKDILRTSSLCPQQGMLTLYTPATVSELDDKASMMVMNQNLQTKKEYAHANSAVWELRMQLDWFRRARLRNQQKMTIVRAETMVTRSCVGA